jgi:hypothetical protein
LALTASLLPQHQKIRGKGVIDATDVREALNDVPREPRVFDQKLPLRRAEAKEERSPRIKARLANSWTRIVLPRSFRASSSTTTTKLARMVISAGIATTQFQMR